MRVLVTGGAGFVGSHLCAALLARGDEVICADNLSSGSMANIEPLASRGALEFVMADVSAAFTVPGRIDVVAHLASPASPPDYLARPLQTLAVGSRGTENALRIAREHGARFVLASTSEVYGDPAVHPQPEEYWGHVNPIGPRSVYDEAKRFSEALTVAHSQVNSVNAGIVRIFNTYGPRMSGTDGRVVTTFISQALAGEPLTVFGEGGQTRSFCYIDDLIRGILLMIDSRAPGPVNLGNPQEMSVADLAAEILRLTGSTSPVVCRPLPADDPVRRRPAIGRAREVLGWTPRIPVEEGLRRTIAWFRSGATALCDVT